MLGYKEVLVLFKGVNKGTVLAGMAIYIGEAILMPLIITFMSVKRIKKTGDRGRRGSGDVEDRGTVRKFALIPPKVKGKQWFATSMPRKRCLLSCSSASIVETIPSSLIIFFAEGGEKYYKYFMMYVGKSIEIRVKLKVTTYTLGKTLSHQVATIKP